jgi:hypothetical protein
MDPVGPCTNPVRRLVEKRIGDTHSQTEFNKESSVSGKELEAIIGIIDHNPAF